MNDDVKDCIVEAARCYMKRKGISQNKLSDISGVSYLSNMMKGVYTYKKSRTGEDSPIADKWFEMLAEAVEYKVQKDYWPLVLTKQFKDIIKHLEEAKNDAKARVIIGETGCGKTYTIKKFVKENPTATFVVTCHSSTTEKSLHDRIMKMLNIPCKGNSDERLDKISVELWRMSREGLNPVLILDEAENLKMGTFQSLKAIYDYLEDRCGIVLIGTGQLIDDLEKLKGSNKKGVPQFYSRFKTGIRYVRSIDPAYPDFLKDRQLEESLKDLLRERAENYRELKNDLEPALREADRRRGPLTEDFFRMINNIPKID